MSDLVSQDQTEAAPVVDSESAGATVASSLVETLAAITPPPAHAAIGKERPDLLSWNVFSATEVAPGRVVSDIRAKQVRFLNENDQFALVNTALESTAEGWCVTKAPFRSCFPLHSTGTATFYNNNRFNNETKQRITAPPLQHEIQALNVDDIAGVPIRKNFGFGENEAVMYRNAYSSIKADLAYLVHQGDIPRLRKIIQFNDKAALPADDFELSYETTYSDPVDFFEGSMNGARLDGSNAITTDKGMVAKRRDADRYVVQEPFYIWDSSRPVTKRQRIQVRLEPLGSNKYTLVKIIPRTFIEDAVFPVYTDTTDTFYSSASDCHVRNVKSGSVSWVGIHDGAGSAAETTSNPDYVVNIRWGDGASEQWNRLSRSRFLFDTSSIPDSDQIFATTFSLYGSSASQNTDLNQSVSVVGGPNGCAVGDFSTWGSTQWNSSDIDIGSLSTSGYNDFALNSTGMSNINLTGTTNVGVRTDGDRTNTEPSHPSAGTFADEQFVAYFSEEAGTSKDPRLMVLHGTIGTGSSLPLKVRKLANQSVSTSTSLDFIDNDLNVGLASNTTYIIDSTVFVEASSSVPDLRIKFVAPSGAEVDLGYTVVSGSSQEILTSNQTSATIPLVGNTPTVIHVSGTVKVGATDGPVQFRWGQATADSALLTVRKGSYLRAEAL